MKQGDFWDEVKADVTFLGVRYNFALMTQETFGTWNPIRTTRAQGSKVGPRSPRCPQGPKASMAQQFKGESVPYIRKQVSFGAPLWPGETLPRNGRIFTPSLVLISPMGTVVGTPSPKFDSDTLQVNSYHHIKCGLDRPSDSANDFKCIGWKSKSVFALIYSHLSRNPKAQHEARTTEWTYGNSTCIIIREADRKGEIPSLEWTATVANLAHEVLYFWAPTTSSTCEWMCVCVGGWVGGSGVIVQPLSVCMSSWSGCVCLCEEFLWVWMCSSGSCTVREQLWCVPYKPEKASTNEQARCNFPPIESKFLFVCFFLALYSTIVSTCLLQWRGLNFLDSDLRWEQKVCESFSWDWTLPN